MTTPQADPTPPRPRPRPSPFALAPAYRAAGWSGTLPLPARQKDPPPGGFTGYDGAWPTDARIAEWLAGGDQNLALRLPPVVIGLDVDGYGDKPGAATLAQLVARWGPLPPTWTTTSREDGVSGIRLYRVPPDVGDWPTEAGPGIEIIRHAHRYAVVPPSIHPEGRPYQWLQPDGRVAAGHLPGLGDLAHLPAGWLAGLTGHGAAGEHIKPGSRAEQREEAKQAGPWLDALVKGQPCRYVARLEADLGAAARREDGDAYDHTRDTVLALLRAGETGHRGVLGVLGRGEKVYVETVGPSRRSPNVAQAEYRRFTIGGVVKILKDPGPRAGTGCDCEGLKIAGITDSSKSFIPPIVEVPNESKRPLFRTAREIGATTPEQPDAVIAGLWVRGAHTELSGKIKASGKTTLLLSMARDVLEGRPCLGLATVRTPIVYLTEQPAASFREALRRAGLLERDDLHVMTRDRAIGLPWPAVVAAAVDRALLVAAGVVVVDTLNRWAGSADENDAAEADRATEALHAATAAALAVVTARHERKSGGDVGEAARGSSAYGGSADILLSLRRPEGKQRSTVRVLRSLSRFDGTPDGLLIELTDAGYIALGDEAAVALGEARIAVLALLPEGEGEAVAVKGLMADLEGVKESTVRGALDLLVDQALVLRIGAGVKGNPYRYHRRESAGPDEGTKSGIHSFGTSIPRDGEQTNHVGHESEALLQQVLDRTGGELLPEGGAV